MRHQLRHQLRHQPLATTRDFTYSGPMPFKSKAQQGYLFSQLPDVDVAAAFAKHTSSRDYAKLPARVTSAKPAKSK